MQGNRETAAPKCFPQHLSSWCPCCCPSTPFQTPFITGTCGDLVPVSLAKMGMKTTKWESSAMWKSWCPDWWKSRIVRIQSWFFFFIGMWQNSYKVRRGLLKIPIIFWWKSSQYNHTEVFSRSMSTFEILVILTSVNYHMLTSRSVCGGDVVYLFVPDLERIRI